MATKKKEDILETAKKTVKKAAIKAAKAQAEEMQKQATAMSNAANISRGKVVYNSKK